MSKSKRPLKKKQVKNLGDVSINDFANAAVIINREKKSSSNVSNVVKDLEVDKSWEDKDFDDVDFVPVENDDGTISYELNNTSSKSKTEGETQPGKDYHLDIWFLISEYLHPEDIGRFSAICKTSYAAIHSAKFWFNLYKRYYRNITGLSERFQPRSILRFYGVKTNVIRSLYHLYPPFVNRLTSHKNMEHPEALKNRQCILMSTKRRINEFVYIFKLKYVPFVRTATRKQDLMEVLEDISANTEDGCRILYISTPDFVHIPPVLGLYLTQATVNLSKSLRHNKVTLGFHSLRGFQGSGDGFISIIIDPVVHMKILDWWHPSYPYNNTINFVSNEAD